MSIFDGCLSEASLDPVYKVPQTFLNDQSVTASFSPDQTYVWNFWPVYGSNATRNRVNNWEVCKFLHSFRDKSR